MYLYELKTADIEFTKNLAEDFEVSQSNVQGDSINEMIRDIYDATANKFPYEFEADCNSIASSLSIHLNGVWKAVHSLKDIEIAIAEHEAQNEE